MENTFFCGASARAITPPSALLPGLRGLGARRFSGEVVSDIHVRCIALRSEEKTALIAAFELDKVPYPERFLEELREKTGVPEEYILLFATHIHTAPVCGVRPDEGINDIRGRDAECQSAEREYVEFLLARCAAAAEEAIAALSPARAGWADGTSYIGVNRVQDFYVEADGNGPAGRVTAPGVNFEGPADHTLFVMRFETLSGAPIAFFINYAVHNTAMIWANSDGKGAIPICADIAGEVSSLLEKRYPGSTAVWSSGAGGDVNPIMMNEFLYPDETTGLGAYVTARGMEAPTLALTVMSRRHYQDVLAVLRNLFCTENTVLRGAAVGWSRTPGRLVRKTGDGGEEILTGGDTPTYDVRETLLDLGGAVLCGFSGEVYTTIGLAIKEAIPKRTVVVNHACSLLSNAGYIFDDATLERLDSSVRKVHVPGYGAESHILPGYVQESLCALTAELYQTIEGKEAKNHV
ncbi:MAG: hypothetical protein IJ617_03800 [Oscillospiraceae bacterium]|nr:hypothetical protein [Oscillospiraceae bacterium]